MKKYLFTILLCLCSFTTFAQTVYYQDLDKKTSIGVGVSDSITLSIINKDKTCKLSFGNVTIDRFTTSKVDKYYVHNIVLTPIQYAGIKQLCKHELVKVNNREYTGLKVGSAIVGSEWYSDYYFNNRKLPFRGVKGGPKPFFMYHK